MKRYPETDQIERRLTRLGKVIRRQHLVKGLVELAVFLTLGALAIFAFDWLFEPPFLVRPALVLLLLGWLAWRFVTRALKPASVPLDAEQVGIIAEHRFPELQSRLISTIQFQRLVDIPPGTSPDLVDGMVHQAFDRTRGLRWGALVDRSWWLRWGPRLLVILLLAAAVPLTAPTYAHAFVMRLIDPTAEYPTRTTITAVAGYEDLAEGDPMELTVTVTGVEPPLGTARLAGVDGELGRELVPDGTGGTYRASFPPLNGDAALSLRVGDDEWGPVTISPRPRVRIAEVTMVATPPAYTRLEPITVEGGSARLPLGSQVELRVVTTKPVDRIALTSTRDAIVPELQAAGDDGSEWVADFELIESLAINLEAVDRDGLHLRDAPTWRIAAMPDRPPRVRLVRPQGQIQLAPASKVPLVLEARDDHAVMEVKLQYRVTNEDGTEGPIQNYLLQTRTGRPVVEFEGIFDNARTGARPGQQVRIWATASDGAPEPHSARSSEVAIEVITEQAYRDLLWTRLGESAEELGEIIPDLKDSRRTIEDLGEQE